MRREREKKREIERERERGRIIQLERDLFKFDPYFLPKRFDSVYF